MITVEQVRALVRTLPRTSEHLIRDQVKFRVGSIVYVAFSRDETVMGFAFPRRNAPRWWRPNRRNSTCPENPTCASTGCTPGRKHSTSEKCRNWSSTRGGWSSRRRSPPPASAFSEAAASGRWRCRRCTRPRRACAGSWVVTTRWCVPARRGRGRSRTHPTGTAHLQYEADDVALGHEFPADRRVETQRRDRGPDLRFVRSAPSRDARQDLLLLLRDVGRLRPRPEVHRLPGGHFTRRVS